ncbi:unnamed protein product [Sphagnum jensenii]|uniref:Probable RuBisCO transcriptional regulator n=1 Tax=Sphagnum jensenii TaxID=128206 RepID=A0ABP0VC42_9BRYO
MQDKTFSGAARSLKITQPTVSQQIAKLEAVVGKLFQRVGHNLVPSAVAKEFYALVNQTLERVDEFEQAIHQAQILPQGLVSYAMPESCQWTPHYKSIMRQLSKLPEVRFNISILPNPEIVRALHEGKIDFGFVVGEKLSPELRFQKFSHEVYSAVAEDQKLFENIAKPTGFEKTRWVTFPGWELFFNTWARHHDFTGRFESQLHHPTVHVGTLAGAIHAIQEGAGVGIIPTHCVAAELKKGSLVEWGKKERAFNPIYLAKRVGEKLPKRVETTIELLSQIKLGEKT